MIFSNDISSFWQQALNERSCVGQKARSLIQTDTDDVLPPDCTSLAVLVQTARSSEFLEVELPISDNGEIAALAFSPNGKLLACGDTTGVVIVFDVMNAERYATLIGHSNAVTCILFLRSDRLASSSTDSTICLWDLRNKNRIKVLNQHRDVVIKQLQAHPNEAESFASVALDSKIYFWKSNF